jgi:hypothetical protein
LTAILAGRFSLGVEVIRPDHDDEAVVVGAPSNSIARQIKSEGLFLGQNRRVTEQNQRYF